MTDELAQARETNRRLNRVNQQLQSDIARDRHIIHAAHHPDDAVSRVEGAVASNMDRSFLWMHRRLWAADNVLGAAEAWARARAAVLAETTPDVRTSESFRERLNALADAEAALFAAAVKARE